MAKQTVDLGTTPNDGTGTPLRTAFDYVNDNFLEIYNRFGDGTTLGEYNAGGSDIINLGNVTFQTGASGGTLRTGTSAADKFLLQAYDVDGAAYQTVIELDAGNTPVLQLRADFLEIDDETDNTKRVVWDVSGATTATATTLTFSQTAARTITFPDATGTLLHSGNIGATVQAHDADLDAIAALAKTDGNFIVGNGSAWVAESGATARASLGLAIGTDVQAFDADILKADTSDQLTAGFSAALDDDGTQSTGTYTPSFATGNYKKVINGGAHTLAPPSPATDEIIDLCVLYVNNASAGTITTSGFTKVTGDSFDTTNTNKFLCRITVFDVGATEYSLLHVTALQ